MDIDTLSSVLEKEIDPLGVNPCDYLEYVQSLLLVSEDLPEFPGDAKNEEKLLADKNLVILSSFVMPPPMQALRVELCCLASSLKRQEKDSARKEIRERIELVSSLLLSWRESEVKKIQRLSNERKMGRELHFTNGKGWYVQVAIKIRK